MILTDKGLLDAMSILATDKYNMDCQKRKFDTDNADLIEKIKKEEEEITAYILEKGETVKTDKISAIWNKGKTSWDGKLLEGYAIAHPDILAARKIGNPTVSFRVVK